MLALFSLSPLSLSVASDKGSSPPSDSWSEAFDPVPQTTPAGLALSTAPFLATSARWHKHRIIDGKELFSLVCKHRKACAFSVWEQLLKNLISAYLVPVLL